MSGNKSNKNKIENINEEFIKEIEEINTTTDNKLDILENPTLDNELSIEDNNEIIEPLDDFESEKVEELKENSQETITDKLIIKEEEKSTSIKTKVKPQTLSDFLF